MLEQIDTDVLNFIHDDLHNEFFDFIMPGITFLGNSYLLWIIITLAFTISRKYRKVGLTMAVALILCAVFSDAILKNIVKRPRPYEGVTGIQLLIPKLTSYSFPSGHTISSFAAAFVISTFNKKWAVPVFVIASLIAFSRMYLYVHYPSDVLGGIILGILFGWAALNVPIDKLISKT